MLEENGRYSGYFWEIAQVSYLSTNLTLGQPTKVQVLFVSLKRLKSHTPLRIRPPVLGLIIGILRDCKLYSAFVTVHVGFNLKRV